jgi:general secretion pathway protein D
MQPVVNYTMLDVGIDIKIKPRIHREGEVTLEMEMKITSIAGTGVADIPILSTREVKNTLRLKDGETNLLAGLLKEEERKSLKGIAGLKNIPLLGRLFSVEDRTLEQTDVILTLTPYIIRTVPVLAEEGKPLWVDVDGMPTTARAGVSYAEEMLQNELLREGEEAPAKGDTNQISLSPTNFEVPANREFRISANLLCEQAVASLSLNINYNPQVMKLKDVIEGGFIRQYGNKVPFLKNIDNNGGVCTLGLTSPDVAKGFKGGNNLVVLVFDAVGQGESQVTISNVVANASNGQLVQFQVGNSRVIVR